MPMRESLMVLLALSFVTGCTSRPANCAQAKKEIAGCLGKYGAKSVDAPFDHCFPATSTENFKGIAAFDFEYSRFFESARSVPTDAWTSSSRPALWFSEKTPEPPEPSPPGWATAVAIEFKGRRVPCDEILEGEQIIIVDEVFSQKLLQERPSLFP